jgi:hypothetical protein
LGKRVWRAQWSLSPKEKKMEISLTPKLEEYIQRQVRNGLYENPSEVVRTAIYQSVGIDRIFTAAGLAGIDVSEAAFFVMMMATKDMDDDIRAIMAEIKSVNAAKQTLRALIKDFNTWISAEMSKHPDSQDIDNDTVRSVLAGLNFYLDEMNEMSERIYSRLQMTMDRRSKFIETLSNIMKRDSLTQDIIAQNLK